MIDPMGDAPEITRAPAKAKKKQPKRRVTVARAQPRQQVEAQAPPRRANPRPVPPRAEAARDVTRENPRPGAVFATGRDGATLTRRRLATGDPLDVPMAEIPQGWSYQWNVVTILNKPAGEVIQGDLRMYQNGWRPVPASRHAGRWTPVGYEGDIVVDGLRLEERPLSLTQDASKEDTAHGRALVRDRTDALRMTQKQLPGAQEARERGNAGGLKMDIDFGRDIPRPEHEIDPDGGEF